MPYNCQQNLFQYSSDGRPLTTGSSFNNAVPPTLIHHHQEQHMKLSPGKVSLPLLASPSLYSNRMSPVTKASFLASETFFAEDEGEDNQPLDLSIHPTRCDQTLKRSHVDEHKPVCMVKSCMCNNSDAQSQHMPRYSIVEHGITRSPNSGMSHSPDSSFTTQFSTYNGGSSNTASPFPSYLTQPWTTSNTESSSFQHLTTSNNVLNDVHNQSNLFRPYDDHTDQDISITSHHHHHLSPVPHPKQHIDVVDSDDDEGPVYMDLDSATTMPLNITPQKDFSGNSHYMYSKRNISPESSAQNRNIEDRMEANYCSQQSTLVQVLNNGMHFSSAEIKPAACLVGGVISHTSLDKSQKVDSSLTNVSSSSDYSTKQKQYPQQQMYLPHSSSPPGTAALPTGHSTYYNIQSNTPPLFQPPKHTESHTYSAHPADGLIYSKVSVSEHSSSSNHFNIDQPGRKGSMDKGHTPGKSIRSSPSNTANTFPQHVSSSTPTSATGVIGNKHRRAGVHTESGSLSQSTSDSKDNENSTKISLLDFWISKILMERSSEAPVPSKHCNVDYICTANGEKKIRLRLVDLMELQVEQSLKA